MTWRVAAGSLRPAALDDRIAGKVISLEKSECFALHFARTPLPGLRVVRASELRVQGSPKVESLMVDPQSLRLADRQPGPGSGGGSCIDRRKLEGDLAGRTTRRIELRPPADLLRVGQEGYGTGRSRCLGPRPAWCGSARRGRRVASRRGAPCSSRPSIPCRRAGWVEEASGSQADHFTCSYQVNGLLSPGQAREFRSVVGVTPAGQLRRGFVYYLERERAQPYRQFLHYNNGYEIGCIYWTHKRFGKPGDDEAFRRDEQRIWIDAIDTFGRELVTKRNVIVDSFACDYMWDDENLVWQFHEGFPDGFGPVQRAAAKYGSHVGVWFSPLRRLPLQAGPRPVGTQSGLCDHGQQGADVGMPPLLRPFLLRLPGHGGPVRTQLFQI